MGCENLPQMTQKGVAYLIYGRMSPWHTDLQPVHCLYVQMMFTNSADIVSESLSTENSAYNTDLSKQLSYTGMYISSRLVCNQGNIENHTCLAFAAAINGFPVLLALGIWRTAPNPNGLHQNTSIHDNSRYQNELTYPAWHGFISEKHHETFSMMGRISGVYRSTNNSLRGYMHVLGIGIRHNHDHKQEPLHIANLWF